MIVDAILAVFIGAAKFILFFFPNVSMPEWYGNTDIVFRAIATIGKFPVIDTIFEIFYWIIIFEIALFSYKIAVMVLTWLHLIGGSGQDPIIK